jgi:hypothetical protein
VDAQEAFDWTSPRGCPSAEEAQAQTLALLGRAAPTSIHVRIERASTEQWEATIDVDDAGTQRLRDVDCAVLTRAVVVAVALVVELSGEAAPPPPAAPEPLSSPPEMAEAARTPAGTTTPTRALSGPGDERTNAGPAPSAQKHVQPEEPRVEQAPGYGELPTTRSRRTVLANEDAQAQLFVGLSPSLGLGMQPGLAPTAMVSMSIVGDAWLIAARVGYAPAKSTQPLAAAGNGIVDVSLAVAVAEIDWRNRWRNTELLLGGSTEVGLLVSQGVQVASSTMTASGWWSAGLNAGVRILSWTWLALGIYGSAHVALLRPKLALQNAEAPGDLQQLFRPSPLSGRFGFYAEARVLP